MRPVNQSSVSPAALESFQEKHRHLLLIYHNFRSSEFVRMDIKEAGLRGLYFLLNGALLPSQRPEV
jgi:hypothetical protein